MNPVAIGMVVVGLVWWLLHGSKTPVENANSQMGGLAGLPGSPSYWPSPSPASTPDDPSPVQESASPISDTVPTSYNTPPFLPDYMSSNVPPANQGWEPSPTPAQMYGSNAATLLPTKFMGYRQPAMDLAGGSGCGCSGAPKSECEKVSCFGPDQFSDGRSPVRMHGQGMMPVGPPLEVHNAPKRIDPQFAAAHYVDYANEYLRTEGAMVEAGNWSPEFGYAYTAQRLIDLNQSLADSWTTPKPSALSLFLSTPYLQPGDFVFDPIKNMMVEIPKIWDYFKNPVKLLMP